MSQSNTQEKIIEAGIELFLEKGYNGAGLKEILAAANVP
ncbi:MAG TPA: TetR/AcrR family transcriptional regulator, partial [Gammaproteobacteria bacterium]|nr:TetR/AcrR family transcriptional regulator [Gammaproteobacteria bacterium]